MRKRKLVYALVIICAAFVAQHAMARPTRKPKPCLPEGKHANDPGRCCSKSTSGNICCGVSHDSCAISGCCDPAGETPHCYQGSCVACFPEGAQGDATSCCIHVAENGLCCGESFGTCANSGCCGEADTPICYQGSCVPCLPDGAAVTNGDETICCSGAVNDAGQCCGEVGATCAASLCCATGSDCDGQTCQPCLEEGHAVTDPSDCCSGTAPNGVCCGLLNESCANSGCCILGVCSDAVCIECLPEGRASSDPNLCCSHEASNGLCCGEENGFCLDSGCCAGGQNCFQFHCSDCTLAGGECTSQLACCEGDCCNGFCIPTDFDPNNCGGCGHGCAAICCASQCIPQCPAGQVLDPDTCTCIETACHDPGQSCGDNGTFDVLCCGEATCCGGTCFAPCPVGESRDPSTCQCRQGCNLPDNTIDPVCAPSNGLIGPVCCNGICCPPGDLCRDGVCIGAVCTGGDIGQPGAQFCPSGMACICRPPNSPIGNPDGCVCCEKCPAGSGLTAHTDCQGGCGDCCSSCVPTGDGSFVCGG